MSLFTILLSALLVNNFVLVRFLGICPFMGVSKQVDSAIGMGLATTFVMVVAAAATWLIQWFILEPFGLPFLQNMSFILVIASMVQLVEMFLHKTSPGLYRAMGIFLPLITTNCAILGLAIMAVQNSYTFIETVIFALGGGLGFTLALILLAGIREELQFADIPKPLRGAGIAFILAGLLSLAFGGFAGLV
ncbi:MAG TPA: electron transport complex subunit RsxA [Firmicutes bacterium]|jgi:electron transport complex protein RnfA|nr:electron transport complex subunit RsxA [Bacillota bacterium]